MMFGACFFPLTIRAKIRSKTMFQQVGIFCLIKHIGQNEPDLGDPRDLPFLPADKEAQVCIPQVI